MKLIRLEDRRPPAAGADVGERRTWHLAGGERSSGLVGERGPTVAQRFAGEDALVLHGYRGAIFDLSCAAFTVNFFTDAIGW